LAANGWLLMLALGSQVCGWLRLSSSIHRLPAAMTSIALLAQPVLTLIWSAVFLREPVGSIQVLGAAVVLVGVGVAHRAVAGGVSDVGPGSDDPPAGDLGRDEADPEGALDPPGPRVHG